MGQTLKRVTVVLLMGGLALMWGCDSSDKKVEQKKIETSQGIELAFVETSEGLPTVGQWRQGLAFHDMNGDGYLDILATPRRAAPEGEKARPVIWYGSAENKWTGADLNVPQDIFYDYGSIVTADFDGDGICDIALAMHGLGLRVLKGLEDGAFVDFSKGLRNYSDFPTRVLTAADVNRDGRPDIIAFREYVDRGPLGEYSGLMWCTVVDGAWECHDIGGKELTTGLLGDQVVVGDIDNDGNLDVAVSSFNHLNTHIVWLGDGKGEFKPFNTGLMQEKHYNSVALADVNGDDKDDLIASVSSFGQEFKGVKAYIAGPDGFTDLSDGLPSGEETWGYFAAAGDLDGDGRAEIIAAPQAGGLKVYKLKGDKWHEVKTQGLPDKGLYRVYNMYIIDINRDGQNDLVVVHADSNGDSGAIRVFLNETKKKQ